MTFKIQGFRSHKDRKYYFRIKSRNGKIIAASEGYNGRTARDKTMLSFAKNMINYKIEFIHDKFRRRH